MALAIRDEVIEELLQGYRSPEDLLGEEGLFKKLKKRLLERALGAELTEHLGYEKGDPAGRGSGNSRNGYSSKTVIGDDGPIAIWPCHATVTAASSHRLLPKARPGSRALTTGSSASMPAGLRFARSRRICTSSIASRSRPI